MAQDLSERPAEVDPLPMTAELPATAGAALQWAAQSAQARLEGCDGVGVLLVRNGSVESVVHTSQRAQQLDWIQGEIGDGPALVAIRQLQVFNVADLTAPGPWPDFGRVARALGIRSGLFVPVIDGGRAWGALSFYSSASGAFKGREQLALGFSAEVAGIAGI